MKLLIIEDEEDLANALAAGFRKKDYVVDIATDGPDGLEPVSYTHLYVYKRQRNHVPIGFFSRSPVGLF